VNATRWLVVIRPVPRPLLASGNSEVAVTVPATTAVIWPKKLPTAPESAAAASRLSAEQDHRRGHATLDQQCREKDGSPSQPPLARSLLPWTVQKGIHRGRLRIRNALRDAPYEPRRGAVTSKS
jgi:hypothetical protein